MLISRWLVASKRESRKTARRSVARRRLGYESLERREVLASVASSLVIQVPGDGVVDPNADTMAIVKDMATDSQSNTFMSGFAANATDGTIVDFDPNHTYADDRDLHTVSNGGFGFLTKYDSAGLLQWKYVSNENFPELIEVGSLTNNLYVGMYSGAGNWISRIDSATGTLVWQSQVDSIAKFTIDEVLGGQHRLFQVSSQLISGYSFAEINAYNITSTGLTASWTAGQIYTSGGSAGWGSGASDIAVSPDHTSIYVAGTFKGNVDFDPSSRSFRLSTGSTSYSYYPAGYVWKLNASTGAFVWADAFTVGKSDSSSSADAIGIDQAGNVIVGGRFHGTVDLDPGKGTLKPTSAGGSDVFVAKLNPAGALIYARTYGTAGSNVLISMVLDAAGDIYLQYSAAAPAGQPALKLNRIVQKVSNAGVGLWSHGYGVQRIGFAGSREGLLVDSLGRVHLYGAFRDALYLEDSLTPAYTSGEQSIFWFTLAQ